MPRAQRHGRAGGCLRILQRQQLVDHRLEAALTHRFGLQAIANLRPARQRPRNDFASASAVRQRRDIGPRETDRLRFPFDRGEVDCRRVGPGTFLRAE